MIDLLLGGLDIRSRKVDFIDHGQYFKVVLEGKIHIRQSLRFDALGGVYEQQGALARGDSARYFVGKVDMTRRIDEVEQILLPVVCRVGNRNGLALDGNAPLPFNVHVVCHLRVIKARIYYLGFLDEAVCKR